MSMVPMMATRCAQSGNFAHDENIAIGSAWVSREKVAERWKISREAQDESH